jgi:CysZ protein
MIINIVIYSCVFFFSYSWLIGNIGSWLGAEEPGASFWIEALHVILVILTFLIVLFICYLLFTVFGSLITAPFNEEISQRVEEIVTNTKQHELGFWQDAYASIKGEVQKIAFYLIILFVLFLFNFVPVIGSVFSTVLGLIFSFFYNALDFLDYPLTRKLATFRHKLKVTQKGGMITYGFGCIAFLMMFLPVVNVFMKPILVVAGTSLYYEKGYGK